MNIQIPKYINRHPKHARIHRDNNYNNYNNNYNDDDDRAAIDKETCAKKK
jgi:hypothetical protein